MCFLSKVDFWRKYRFLLRYVHVSILQDPAMAKSVPSLPWHPLVGSVTPLQSAEPFLLAFC